MPFFEFFSILLKNIKTNKIHRSLVVEEPPQPVQLSGG